MRTLCSKVGMALVVGLAIGSAALGQDPATKPAEPAAPAPAPQGNPMEYVRMSTSMGEIVLELNREKAPLSVQNFLNYADKGYYEGTIFHRVIDGFMIQGGGYTADLKQKETDPPIKNEWQNGLKNARGTIAMARTASHDSATSQFYINVVNNGALDQPRDGAAYAVFGTVIAGFDVVDKIKAVAKEAKGGGFQDLPVVPVTINSVKRAQASELTEAIAASKKVAEDNLRAISEAKDKAITEGIAYVKSQGVDVAGGSKSPSGLWSVDSKVGDGAQPTATSTVKVHYSGWLTNGTPVDSSVERGQPATRPLNKFIKGWVEGVAGMKVGGTRYLVIPPELAYGDRGSPPVVPAKATLVFKIELLDIVAP